MLTLQQNNINVPKGVRRTYEEKLALFNEVIDIYKKGEYGIENCCRKVGFAERSFNVFVADNADIAATYKKAQRESDKNRNLRVNIELVKTAKEGLKKLLNGQGKVYKEKKTTYVNDGNGNMVLEREEVKEVYEKATAGHYALALNLFDETTKDLPEAQEKKDYRPVLMQGKPLPKDEK